MDIIKKLRAWHSPGETITGDVQLYLDAADEIEWLRGHIRALIENNPNDDAADGMTVLDVWRKQALERLGEWPDLTVPEDPFN